MSDKDNLKTQLTSILKDNLYIHVEHDSKDINIPYGPLELIRVSVYFGEELLDESSCFLPQK